jgi:ribonuclease HI
MKEAVIYCDGASKGNPGPGGYGAIILINAKVHELGGYEKHTTNNRMELQAAIKALEYVASTLDSSEQDSSSSKIIIYTDSSYLINGATKWLHGWIRNNWITSLKKEVLNKDLWEKISELVNNSPAIKWIHVGGHVGIAGNERVDEIASGFASEEAAGLQLFSGSLSDYSIDLLNVSLDQHKAKKKSASKSRSKAQAYSYVSAVNGKIMIHKTWEECEKRVKGVSGTRFKKALNKDEEKEIIASFTLRK